MAEEFDVTPEKLALAKEIVDIQRPFMDVADRDVDVYIGIPFCPGRGAFIAPSPPAYAPTRRTWRPT